MAQHMLSISVNKAEGADVPDLVVEARQPPARDWQSPDQLGVVFDSQAARLVDGLVKSLPGGLISSVLVRLLEHRRSLLVVLDEPRTSDDVARETRDLVREVARLTLRLDRLETVRELGVRMIAAKFGAVADMVGASTVANLSDVDLIGCIRIALENS